MKSKLEAWKTAWFGLHLGLSAREIDLLIDRWQFLKREPDQHFHVSSNYKGDGGLGDIEVYVKHAMETDDMFIGGPALLPGEEIETVGRGCSVRRFVRR